jgi:hypothetical protein
MIATSTLKKHIGTTMTAAGHRFKLGLKDIGFGTQDQVWSTKDYLVTVDFDGKGKYDVGVDVRYMGGKEIKFEYVAHEAYKGTVKNFDEYKTIVRFLINRAFEKTEGKPVVFKRDGEGRVIRSEEDLKLETFTRSQIFNK